MPRLLLDAVVKRKRRSESLTELHADEVFFETGLYGLNGARLNSTVPPVPEVLPRVNESFVSLPRPPPSSGSSFVLQLILNALEQGREIQRFREGLSSPEEPGYLQALCCTATDGNDFHI